MSKHKAIIPFLALAAIALLLWIFREYAQVNLPGISFGSASTHYGFSLDTIARWLAVGAFVYYGVSRRSLAVWIVAGMLIGVEAGHDFPSAVANLQVLSTIFLH